MGIPDHLTFLLRSLYTGQEATARTRHEITDWLKIEKGVPQGYILSPCLFNLYVEYIMWNAGLDSQAKIKIPGRNFNLRYLNGIKWRWNKKPLEEGEREEWKSWLKTEYLKKKKKGIQSHHFMAHWWGKSGSNDKFYFLGLQKSLQIVISATKLKDTCFLEEKL